MKDTTRNTKESRKICPVCKEAYPEEDNYCGSDGTRLEILDSKTHSSKSHLSRDAGSGALAVTGHSES